MKVGDKVPVTIAGQVVAQASIKETGDGTATLVVPATLVVMATRTELAVETPQVDTTGTETLITGVERTSGEPVESAVVGDSNAQNDNSSTEQASTPATETATVETQEVSGATETTEGTSSDAGQESGTSTEVADTTGESA